MDSCSVYRICKSLMSHDGHGDSQPAVGQIDRRAIQASVTGLLKNDIFIILIVLLFAFGVRYMSLMDQGITWDEPIYVDSGISYVHNLVTLDFSHGAWIKNIEHPPFGKLLYGVAAVLL